MDTTTPLNVPLLRKAVEWVEEQDALDLSVAHHQALLEGSPSYEHDHGTDRWWNQQTWLKASDCGTAMCLAGFVVTLAGYEPTYDAAYCALPGKYKVTVSDTAQQLLGLSDLQAGRLFAPNNTAADIRELAEAYAGEKL